jgi:hypothetical protein
MSTSTFRRDRAAPRLNAGRLWAGGIATAIVAALVVLVGISITRGIFGVPVPAPAPAGGISEAGYVGLAAGAAIVATGLLHLLIAAAPRPLAFFGWIVFLATVVAVLAPFSNSIFGSFGHIPMLNSKSATATINLVAGIAIGSLLTGVARSAFSRGRPESYPEYPTREY